MGNTRYLLNITHHYSTERRRFDPTLVVTGLLFELDGMGKSLLFFKEEGTQLFLDLKMGVDRYCPIVGGWSPHSLFERHCVLDFILGLYPGSTN